MSDMTLQGYNDVYNALGITKEARFGVIGRAASALKSKLPTLGGLKRFVIGEPGRFMNEIRAGKAFSKGSLMRESFQTPGMMNKALFYGFPAVEGYNILSKPGPMKAERLGELLGDTAMYTATWKPLGYVGSALVGGIGGKIGRGAVQIGKHMAGAGPKVVQHGMPRPVVSGTARRFQAMTPQRY